VVPVFDGKAELIAVYDVDSTQINSFDALDQFFLEKIMERHFQLEALD
jgi:putative methionine-R-sulfoxide reductase with GAF domain